jgi:hypothetical protein
MIRSRALSFRNFTAVQGSMAIAAARVSTDRNRLDLRDPSSEEPTMDSTAG